MADQPQQWVHWLSWSEYWYNTNCHAYERCFEVVYDRKPLPIIQFLPGEVRVEAAKR